jgi:flagellin
MTSAPATGGGTYRFTSGGGNSLTLTGPDGVATIGVGSIAANGTETLTFGNIGFTLTAGANGMTAAAIVASLTQPANDTIVVNSTGSAGVPRTLTTAASTGAVFQIGANEGDNLAVGFANAQTAAYTGFDAAITAFTSGLNSTTAGALITATDTAIASVSSIRGGYGAVENRLSHTVASISVASENLNASESRIKDLDVASEMVNFTKTQILQQAGTSILAQANSAPQSILTLLR